MECLRVGRVAAVAAGVLGAGVAAGSASAGSSLFSSQLTLTFDAITLQEVADKNLNLPTVTGQVVYEVDDSEPVVFSGFNTSVASPGNGLVSLDIGVKAQSGDVINLDETLDVDFPDFPSVDLFDNQVVGIDYEVDIPGGDGFISGNQFGGSASIFVIEGSGTVSYGEAIFIGTEPSDDPVDGGGNGGSPSTPNVIPTPSAAAAGVALMGLIAARRRQD